MAENGPGTGFLGSHFFPTMVKGADRYKLAKAQKGGRSVLRHIGLLEADEDKIRKIRPKGTLVTILYVPREAICPKGG